MDTRQFDTGATRDSDSQKLDYEGFISPLVDRRFAEYMHKCRLRNVPVGQAIRASDNWQKGMPLESYAKSLVRHINEFRLIYDGFEAFDEKGNKLDLEEVLCAIRFNVDGYLFETIKERYGRESVPKLPEGKSLNPQEQTMRNLSQKIPHSHSSGFCWNPDCRKTSNLRRFASQSGVGEDDGGLAKARSATQPDHDGYSEWHSQSDGCSSQSD